MAKFRKEDRILDIDASMQGTLSFKDPVNLRINGMFEGKLMFRGILTIGKDATVKADITGENIFIEGIFNGKMESSGIISLRKEARVEAELFTSGLEIEEGAFFEGVIKMNKDMLSMDEISKFLNVDKDKVESWVKDGKIPYVQKEEGVYFAKSKIEEWLAKGRV